MSETLTNTEASKKKWLIYTINSLLATCIIGGIIWGISTYFILDREQYTNDAQVEEYVNPVNTRVSGYIKTVNFEEHRAIKKGDTLATIDDREYRIALELAQAAYLSATAAKNVTAYSVHTVESNLSVTDANIKAAQSRLWNAEQNFHRYENLLKEGAATQQQFDQVKSDYDALADQTNALIRSRHTTSLSTDETTKRIGVNDAEIKRAQATVDMAKLNLSYCVIRAPYSGVSGRRTVQEGQLVQAGQTLLSFVRTDNKWVIANYMETQVPHLHIGQKVKLKIDGLGDDELRGTISAISEATGSRYSAIPLDNSTGNFVKVQQRIPVRIEFDRSAGEKADLSHIRAGMNVEVRTAD